MGGLSGEQSLARVSHRVDITDENWRIRTRVGTVCDLST